MKEGWTYKKIKDIGTVIGGTTPSTNNPAYWDGDLCWISPAELHGEHYLYDSVKKITPLAVKEKSLKLLPIGTVILSSRAPIGKLAINKVPIYCNQGFKCVVCGENLFNEYLYWWFYFKKDYLVSLGTGATFPEISKTVVENIIIPVPPLSEQQSIVERLDSAFAQIDALKANAEKQLSEARQLFQSALTEAMTPKEGWEEKKLGDITVFSQGIQVDVNLQTEIFAHGKVRFLRIIDVTQGNVPPRYIDDPGERYHLKADEIAMVRYGTVGFVCFGLEGVIANNLFKISIKDKSKLKSNYLQYFLKSDLFQSHIRKGIGGAALPAIKFGDIKNILLWFPPLSEQQSIVARLDSLSAKVRELEAINKEVITECDNMKQAILREVFE